MKKILFWTAVMILAAVSCNKIEEVGETVNEPSNVPCFTAYVDGADIDDEEENKDPESRTVISGMSSLWDGTESIRVFDGKVKNGKIYTAEADMAESVIFSEVDGTVRLAETEHYLAVYPEGPAGSVTWSGKITDPAKNFWLPEDQTPTPNSYDPATHIAVACTKSNDLDLKFKNVTALVKLEVPCENITDIYFYGNSKETIAGNFDVLYNGGKPEVVSNSNSTYEKYTDVKLSAPNGGTFEKGAVYYLSILPTNFSNGFTIEFIIGGIKYIKKLNAEYTVGRNEVITLPKMEFTTFTPVAGKVYLKPNDDWRSDAARFAAYFYDTANNYKWVDMTRVPNTYIYVCDMPVDKDYVGVIFGRMNPKTTTNSFNDGVKWNQTGDQLLCIGNVFEITDWDKGKWSGSPIYKDYLFLKPNSNWNSDGARFAAYFFDNGTLWLNMKDVNKDGIYEVRKPTAKNYPKVIFGRMNPGTTANNFNDGVKWNQTGNLNIPTDGKNLFTISGWGDGSWSKKTF